MKAIVRKPILLSPPHMSGLEHEYIVEAFETNWIAPLGPHVDAFERELAVAVGASGACAVNSGTAALHLALSLLGVGQGDVVFCSSLTFVASANPIVYVGAEPVFIDAEPETWNMSPLALQAAFEHADKMGTLPKAVIVVHLYGMSAKMDEIVAICDRYNVPIIEDAAESLGSTYRGKASGTIGTFGVYSFNGNKIISTSGGGMLVSEHTDMLDKARFLASQAKDTAPYYEHSKLGYNYRMSNVLAGIGRAQLAVLNDRIARKRHIYEAYVQALSSRDYFTFVPDMSHCMSNRWLTTLLIDEQRAGFTAQELIMHLHLDDIEARRIWKPMHLQPLYERARFFAHDGYVSIAERLFQSGICLPSGTAMDDEDINRVIQSIMTMAK